MQDHSDVPSDGYRETRYYNDLGQAHDELMRCKDCRALILASTLRKLGCCPCGNKRVVEITTLSEAEHARILSGELDFPHRALFLKEFTGVEV